ncbi:MAG: flagellar hook-associated protein 2 [Haliea sp.]|nr:flagellar hook-associated protein 2 [Haliea sp.]|tara:strand:+ start:320834 stop:322291 length:1458 start_codon:yes stop_codon:yes gene_type:complete
MVSVTGIGSGLDIDSLVSQLVAAERAPQENRLLRREAAVTSELSAFGALKGALGSVQGALEALTQPATFVGRSVKSSDSAAVAATVSAEAAPGSYRVTVANLASAQSLASEAFADSDAPVGEGQLTFRFGSLVTSGSGAAQSVDSFSPDAARDPLTLTVDSSNNSLAGIRDAINALEAGVTATIVNDAGGARLLFSSDDTGVGNGFVVEVSDSGDGQNGDSSGLSRLAFNTAASNLEQTVAGDDARFTLNGLSLSSAGNQVNNVVDGLSLQLKSEVATPVTVDVSRNRAAVTQAIDRFVNAYNQFVGVAGNLTRYDPESGRAGALQGDFSARAVTSQLRSALQREVGLTGEGVNSLLELGIQTAVDGTLSVDREQLNRVLDAEPTRVANLFSDSNQGLAPALDQLVAGFLGDTGLLTTRTDSLSQRIQSIEAGRESLNRRMESVEQRYLRQFNALDSLLAELQSTGDFLNRQLASIPLPGNSSNN